MPAWPWEYKPGTIYGHSFVYNTSIFFGHILGAGILVALELK